MYQLHANILGTAFAWSSGISSLPKQSGAVRQVAFWTIKRLIVEIGECIKGRVIVFSVVRVAQLQISGFHNNFFIYNWLLIH